MKMFPTDGEEQKMIKIQSKNADAGSEFLIQYH